MRQYRWFNNRVGQKVYRLYFDDKWSYLSIEVKNKDHAFELWSDGETYYDEKEFNYLKKIDHFEENKLIKEGLQYVKKNFGKAIKNLSKED